MRKVIIDERALNPKYYDKMSELLDVLIEERRKGALDYQAYLAKLLDAAEETRDPGVHTSPAWADDGAKRALVDFFAPQDDLAMQLDAVVRSTKRDSWVGNALKERRVRRAIAAVLPPDFDRLDELFELVKARYEYR